MKKIRITRMKMKHLPEVLKIENDAFSPPWSLSSFALEMENPLSDAYVAVQGEKVLGYTVLNRIIDEGHLLKLAVHPDFRRRGIGKVLTEKALEVFRSGRCIKVWLEVRDTNVAARKLYEGIGFRVVSVRKKYYPSGEDGVVMACEL